eukprot:CAMPEP_0176181292 /NCGR_PEP_ID=MMETSP0120_2-20121206/92892_1 /TAXON_ID=160619 /ORGANISM="Kryptoperidinium foliaceum, Strain CCMP 1326" /LENGTH=306 /DNA_ID=CAMNT_0017519517 /DNA_START=302 /DNA_END=1218 /DNA_ORIENTATION=+
MAAAMQSITITAEAMLDFASWPSCESASGSSESNGVPRAHSEESRAMGAIEQGNDVARFGSCKNTHMSSGRSFDVLPASTHRTSREHWPVSLRQGSFTVGRASVTHSPQGPGERCGTTLAYWYDSARAALKVARGSIPLSTNFAWSCWTKVDGSWLKTCNFAMHWAADGEGLEAPAAGDKADPVKSKTTSNCISQLSTLTPLVCKRLSPGDDAGMTPLTITCSTPTSTKSAIADWTAPWTSRDTSLRPLSVTKDDTTSTAASVMVPAHVDDVDVVVVVVVFVAVVDVNVDVVVVVVAVVVVVVVVV